MWFGKNFTEEDLDKIKNMDHVDNVERKITVVGTVDTDEDRTLQLNFIESNEISKLYIADGEEFSKEKSGIWLDEYYSKNNDIKVGDTIKIKLDKDMIEEEVIALVNVPDHVYDIKDESSIFPNHIDYGFAYLSVNEIPDTYVKRLVMEKQGITDEDAFDKAVPNFNAKDYLQFSHLMIDVDKEENKNKVKSNVENEIEGVAAVTDIKDSFSYSTYQGEIEEGETYVGVFSGLFLFIAILSVITTMTRVVKKQRIQIGTLKALGFKKSKITMHYVGYGFWISLIGTILGVIIGPLALGNLFMSMEMSYFQIPNGHSVVAVSSFAVAALVVFAVSFVTYFTCRSELKENPAETLRTKLPNVKQKSINITTKGLFKNLSFASKWNIRDILRNKMRTFMGIAGITGCCMLLVCAFGMLDSMNHFVDLQFNTIYDFKYKLSINEEATEERIKKVKDEYGDNTSQTIAIEIKDGDNAEGNTIFVDDSNNHVRVIDEKENYIDLQDDGVFVTRKLAEVKGYKIGDTISWHIYGDDTYYESEIVGFDKSPQTQNVKTTRKYLESLGIEYKPDTIYTDKDLSDVKEIDGIEIIQDIETLKNGVLDMLNTMRSMVILIIVVAAILGSVIIYNLGVLSFTEKQYQFATLKVLGFKEKRIKSIYVRQNNWITYTSIIIGLPLGYFMVDWIFKMALSDNYDFGAFVKFLSYIYATVGTYIVSLIVSKLLARKVKKIDMVTSLKGNE